jgi:glycosyltransferase involved in cell wall biosynthesis
MIGGRGRLPRVAVVTPRFPPQVGGMERYAGWTAETLAAAGHDVTVISTTPGPWTRREDHDGIPVIRLGSWATLSNTPVSPLWPVQLRRLLTELEVDVVNAHAPVPGIADVAAYVSPVPVVLTYHSGSLVKGGHPVDPALRAYERHVLPRVFDRCAELVAVSPVAMTHATGRAHLLPPGVDTTRFTPGEEDREQTVLYVGRVERTSRWKGLDVLIAAMPRLLHPAPRARLVVVGDGDDVRRLQDCAAELGVAHAIDWRGAVDHWALPELYRRAGVTVLPSLTEAESFGITLVEAMASGCPVVASRVGGIPYVVRDGVDGQLVTPGDPTALADALADVLLDPARAAEMGAGGREAAASRWDWTCQERRLVDLIEGVAGVTGPRTREVAA